MPKYRCEILLPYTLLSGEGQIETLIMIGDNAGEAHQMAVNQYYNNNPDSISAETYGTPVEV